MKKWQIGVMVLFCIFLGGAECSLVKKTPEEAWAEVKKDHRFEGGIPLDEDGGKCAYPSSSECGGLIPCDERRSCKHEGDDQYTFQFKVPNYAISEMNCRYWIVKWSKNNEQITYTWEYQTTDYWDCYNKKVIGFWRDYHPTGDAPITGD